MKKYKLIKEEDQSVIECSRILWAEWDEWDNQFASVNKEPAVGKSLMMINYISPKITKITEITENHIKFKTKEGTYKLIINHARSN